MYKNSCFSRPMVSKLKALKLTDEVTFGFYIISLILIIIFYNEDIFFLFYLTCFLWLQVPMIATFTKYSAWNTILLPCQKIVYFIYNTYCIPTFLTTSWNGWKLRVWVPWLTSSTSCFSNLSSWNFNLVYIFTI